MSHNKVMKQDLLHEEKGERATTALLRKNMLATLHTHYPQVSQWRDMANPTRTTAWLIDIRDFKTGGVVTIRNLWLSGSFGVMIHLKSLDPEGRVLVRYAGELLERYNIARDKGIAQKAVIDNILNATRNFKGEMIHER